MAIDGSRTQTYMEIVNATSSTTKKKVKVASTEEGTNLVSTGDFYTKPNIDVGEIKKLRDDIYIAGVVKKQKNLIFNEKYHIEVEDVKTRKVDEELSNTIFDMCESKSVQLWASMAWTYDNLFHYGISTFNPVWKPNKEFGDIRLEKLKWLPPESFKTLPQGQQTIYSPILQGIVPDKDGELSFYQEPELDKTPELIKNVFYVKNPSDPGFAGNPIIVPCIAILGMLGFTWNTQMEQVNRVGAKILFMQVTNPTNATTNRFKSLDYANDILAKWGKDTAFAIPDNFTPVDLKMTDDLSNLAVIDKLDELISKYVNPAAFLTDNQTNKLGGNDGAKLEMHDNYVKGWHSMISEQYEILLNNYLIYNEYEGYRVHIKIPPPTHSTRADDREDAVSGFLTQSLFPNEIRKLLRQPSLADADLAKLAAYYSTVVKTPQNIRPV